MHPNELMTRLESLALEVDIDKKAMMAEVERRYEDLYLKIMDFCADIEAEQERMGKEIFAAQEAEKAEQEKAYKEEAEKETT